MLPVVFIGGSPAGDNLTGKFAIKIKNLYFSFRENYPESIICQSRCYPTPELNIKRLNKDDTVTGLSFGGGNL